MYSRFDKENNNSQRAIQNVDHALHVHSTAYKETFALDLVVEFKCFELKIKVIYITPDISDCCYLLITIETRLAVFLNTV